LRKQTQGLKRIARKTSLPRRFRAGNSGKSLKLPRELQSELPRKYPASEGSVRHHRQQAGISDITHLAKARLASIAVMASGPGSIPGLFRAISDAVEHGQGQEAVFGVI
jgi:hypothetical protein